MKENILCIVAHSDDQVVGMGGTIAKYAKEGKDVTEIIFSFGELSNPIMKKEIVSKTRVNESKRVGKFLGVKKTIFLGVPDYEIPKKLKDKKFLDSFANLIKKQKPNKIFTHSWNDLHGIRIQNDHKAVYDMVFKILKESKLDCELYCFDVWNPINMFRKDKIKMLVDVSNTFGLNLKALRMFKSQKHFIYPLYFNVLVKAVINGRRYGCRYAEKFFKVA